MRPSITILAACLGLVLALIGCSLPVAVPPTVAQKNDLAQTQTAEFEAALPVYATHTAAADQTAAANATPELPEQTPTLPAPTAAQSPAGSSLTVTTGRIQEESDAPPAVIEIEYPIFTDSAGSPVPGINAEVNSLIDRQLESFRTMLAEAAPPPDTVSGPNSLRISYEVLYNADGLGSIYFPLSTYSQGAAHPFPFSEAITYDVNQGRRLELSGLFKPGVDYLNLLSQYSIEDLNRQGVLFWEDGAQPRPENFKTWNLTPEGLRITFDPYQVSPYALGYQTVILPWGTLITDLNPLPGIVE